MADDALVFVAKETIASADEDGTRTESEIADIQDAVSCVVVQGAMEEAGLEKSAGSNPILGLNHEDTQPDLAASIDSLHKEGATLHDGESVAGLAERTIERNKVWNLTRVSEQLGSNEGGWHEAHKNNPKYRQRTARSRWQNLFKKHRIKRIRILKRT